MHDAVTMPEQPRRRADGDETHATILDAAMRIASIEGLGSLSIGRLARELEMSKSGVFAHFRSKLRLQRETIEAARAVFESEVVRPGLAAPEGIRRVEAFCEAYLSYLERAVFPGGCFFAHVLAEFDAHSGPIHDEVAADQRGWEAAMRYQIGVAKQRGEIAHDTDGAQLTFELLAALEFANYQSTLKRDPGVIDLGRRAVRGAVAQVRLEPGS